MNAGIMRGKLVWILAVVLSYIILISAASAGQNSAELKVMPVQMPESPNEYRYHVVSGRSGFKEVTCFAGFLGPEEIKDYDGKCFPISLKDKSFLLADCFVHSQVAYSYRLVKFKGDGTLDGAFQTPFASDYAGLMSSPENAIKAIEQVKVSVDGAISIEGSFISPLIGWSEKQASDASGGIGDDVGKEGTVVLTKDGKFKLFKAAIKINR